MDRFVEDGSLDDNVESFLSHDEMDPRETMGRGMDVAKGASLSPSLLFFLIPVPSFCTKMYLFKLNYLHNLSF